MTTRLLIRSSGPRGRVISDGLIERERGKASFRLHEGSAYQKKEKVRERADVWSGKGRAGEVMGGAKSRTEQWAVLRYWREDGELGPLCRIN